MPDNVHPPIITIKYKKTFFLKGGQAAQVCDPST